MRIKLSANSPLPPFKAWYPVHPNGSVPLTISLLKTRLCASLDVFHGLNPSSLQLSIDGFELLDGSDISVLRDGDLVDVDLVDTMSKGTAQALPTSSLRGAPTVHPSISQNYSHGDPGPSTSHKRKRRMSTPTSSSSSESETDSPSSSSSASESESDDSDSESESGSGSETSESESESESESSPPPVESLRKTALATQRETERRQLKLLQQPKPQVVHPQTFVPPGYGKPQTRSRNLRRRLKRIHEREAATASISGPVSGANAVVSETGLLSQRETPRPSVPDASWDGSSAPDLPSLSLRNKNKAKNFRSLIGKPLPPKIIFADEEGGVSASASGSTGTPDLSKSATPDAVEDTVDRQAVTQTLPRLIPPSSRSSLPSNLFVTSIDAEAGLRRNRKKRRMRVEYGDGFDKEHGVGSMGVEEHGADISLDYGNADTDAMDVAQNESRECDLDVDALESKANKQWDRLEKMTMEQQVVPGCIVGYKALGINPVTYTPEYLLTLVRVQAFDKESIGVRPLRPHAEVSFSGPVGENEEGDEAEQYSWGDIENGDWRIVERV